MAHVYDPHSLNMYAFVRNDLVNWVDPDWGLRERPVIRIYHDVYTYIETRL
jgi:hypothetical protein